MQYILTMRELGAELTSPPWSHPQGLKNLPQKSCGRAGRPGSPRSCPKCPTAVSTWWWQYHFWFLLFYVRAAAAGGGLSSLLCPLSQPPRVISVLLAALPRCCLGCWARWACSLHISPWKGEDFFLLHVSWQKPFCSSTCRAICKL